MGSARMKHLLTVCSSALGAHSAPFPFLCTIPGFSRALATALKATPLETGRTMVEHAARLGAKVLVPDDAEYPALLRPIPDPPPVLFALGNHTLQIGRAHV